MTVHLKTTLAKNVFRVVGKCQEVLDLDSCRTKLRLSASKENKAAYENALAKAETKVLRAHSQLKKDINDWEIDWVKKKGREPWGEDLKKNTEIHQKYKALKIANELLKHWKITVHF